MTAVAVALILAWGAAEKGPPRWDDSWYLAAAVRLFDRFAEDGLLGYLGLFLRVLGDKAPLITALPLPFFCLLGRTTFVIYLVNSVAAVVMARSLYRFARGFVEERVALLAVFLALTSPLLAGLSRLFLAEYWLTALVVAACATLARWEQSTRPRWLLWLGILSGLGLLMKITFPLFVGPVAAVILWRARRKAPLRLVVDLVLIAIPALAVAGPWYFTNWDTVAGRSVQESYFTPTHPVERESPAGMALDYLLLMVNQGWTAAHVAAAAAGLVVWVIRRRDNFLGGAAWYVVPWVATLPVFALSQNRDLRLIAPAIPAMALVIAALVDRLAGERRAARRMLFGGVGLAAAAITAAHATAVVPGAGVRLGPWQLLGRETDYAFAPNPQRWPLQEVLDRLAQRERLGPGSRLVVGLGADTWSLNSNNLDLEAALGRYPIEFHTTAYTSNRDLVRRIMSGAQYFVWKDGGTQKPMGRFEGGPMTLEFLLDGPLFREVPPAIAAPDGGRIRIFENARAGPDIFSAFRAPTPLPALPKADLNFGDFLQITGLRLTEREGLFTLALAWRCRNPVPSRYRLFAHVVDPQGKLLGSMDHEILHGSPPVDQWQPGDEGYEARHAALPAAAVRNARVRLGLFHPDTKLRPPVWASTLPLEDDFTAAVAEPNAEPSAGYTFRMTPAPAMACDVRFEQGLRLRGYSLHRSGNVAWLRLHWTAPGPSRSRLYFFGHVVGDQSPEPKILASFDQDLGLDKLHASRRGGGIEWVQDVVREVSRAGPDAKWIRAGLFDMDRPLDRVAIRSSSLPMNRQQKAIFIPY